MSPIVKNEKNEIGLRLLCGTPSRGLCRIEWVVARYGQIIPCNWSMAQVIQSIDGYSPVGFLVADAQNIIVRQAVEQNAEWLLLIEDDTCPPADAFLRLNEYMRKGEVPIVSGLYYTKASPPEPLVYRGRGNSYYGDWTMGDLVWADGVPTGFLLIHGSILRLMWEESPEYSINGFITRRVFEQPEQVWLDPETEAYAAKVGTSDLEFCTRIMRDDVLRRAGWTKIAKKKYPFLVDTNIFCYHVDQDGTMFPPQGVVPNAKPKRSASK